MEDSYDDSNDIIVEETPEYSPKSEFNKASIVSEAVKVCMGLRAKPMVPGYENTKQSSDGTTIRIREPDNRQAYVSAVIALRSLLAPEIKRDEKFTKFYEEIQERINEVYDSYAYEDLKLSMVNGQFAVVKTGKKFIPEIDEILRTPMINISNRCLNTTKGYWNAYVNAYWDEMVDICDDVFSEINCLIDRMNYFKPEISF